MAINSVTRALGSGLTGALVMTALHETARRTIPAAPRLDTLGRRAIAEAMREMNMRPPKGTQLQRWALAGDLVFNSLYFGLAGASRNNWWRAPLLGLGAGLSAVALPPTLKLGRWPTRRTSATKWMTVGLYVAGGLATAVANTVFANAAKQRKSNDGAEVDVGDRGGHNKPLTVEIDNNRA
ncbi:MAG TPA: hypothetical protein VFZ34_14130 [Blastocatellia bacterium]|nr:hypothetical protein [Blastocatellia bacterium]